MSNITEDESRQIIVQDQIQSMIDSLEFMIIDIGCFELAKPKAAKCVDNAVGKVQEGISNLQDALVEI